MKPDGSPEEEVWRSSIDLQSPLFWQQHPIQRWVARLRPWAPVLQNTPIKQCRFLLAEGWPRSPACSINVPWKYIFELRKQRLKNIWVSFFLTGEVWKDRLFLFLGFQHWFLRKYCSAHPSVLRGPNTQSINVFFLTQSCFCCSQSGDSNSYRDCECSMCKGRSTGKLFELWHLDTCLQRCLPRNPNESW